MAGMEFKKTFGESVKNRRRKLGLSQEALAERADLHRTYVCDVERGARNLSLQSIEKLARALQTSIANLFPEANPTDRLTPSSPVARCVEVLLVEDNPDDVTMTMHTFKKARFANHVDVVYDGAEALDYLFGRGRFAHRIEGSNPSVVLLDLYLPKVSGLEVLRRVKSDERTKNIPIIILTGSQRDADFTECQRLGADTYIVKPVDFQKFIHATPLLRLDWALIRANTEPVQNVMV